MKSLFRILTVAAGVALCGSPAEAVIDNPVTKAVIAVYDRQLRENPTDYMTWFRRANEYYRHDEYIRALDDVNMALAHAPAGDKDLRFQAYMLRAGIYNQTNRNDQALGDLNSALALDPASYAAVYQRANVEYELGNYPAARGRLCAPAAPQSTQHRGSAGTGPRGCEGK